ncbi:rhodanese-like domain-containing protein [Owenweeksia hongkongensis]|uniref:Rhodanese-related sulfurtransferase n=1 Tax=Owenweeksia hongkongensis (strain DSM 17368 / CIP 108786 / JCM 12287 / NRRL B-23963 / UST20020801) TaxID=926562 RepID=G8R1F3_OWEHD|nr:rhodanese-like domain-containing protein [Owenweeksia hongkongensis]AEV33896.1 Rhodanese-related sulfurtransferase [Owenweeksia hongkongensis DSM 17368]
MGLFSIFSNKGNKLKEFADKGAIVVDVRTPGEFKSGHGKGARNIPLQNIGAKTAELKKLNKPIILCCASGMRSAQATGILKKAGIDCMNGGSWGKVDRSI